MKKLITALLVFTLILTVSAAAFAEIYYIKTQSGNYVNVRSGRGTDYDKIGKLKHGDHIDVVNIKRGWAKFNYGSYGYGYISANYITKNKPAAVSDRNMSTSSAGSFDLVKSYNGFEIISYTAVVQPSISSNSINLRWAPSTNAPIMGLRRAGCVLRVIAENGTWCQVVDDATGECGFMMKKFLLEGANVIGQEG